MRIGHLQYHKEQQGPQGNRVLFKVSDEAIEGVASRSANLPPQELRGRDCIAKC